MPLMAYLNYFYSIKCNWKIQSMSPTLKFDSLFWQTMTILGFEENDNIA